MRALRDDPLEELQTLREERGYTVEEMQPIIVSKAIWSHDPKERSDFTVMILFGEQNGPAFWRPVDASWTVILYTSKENFYVISGRNVLYVVDFDPNPKMIEVGPQIRINNYPLAPSQKYLVDFNGNLLLIERFCKSVEKNLFITSALNVIELNWAESCLMKGWILMNMHYSWVEILLYLSIQAIS